MEILTVIRDFEGIRTMSKVYFITGASSGFGAALARAALERGDRAILAARRIDALEEIARDSYAAWANKMAAVRSDLDAWRAQGLGTSFSMRRSSRSGDAERGFRSLSIAS